jgi:hypothetical protein
VLRNAGLLSNKLKGNKIKYFREFGENKNNYTKIQIKSEGYEVT